MISRNVPASANMSCCSRSILYILFRQLPIFLLIIACLCVSALAQSADITVGFASGLADATVTVPVTFTPGTTDISTLQFDLAFSSSLIYGSTETGPAATESSKNVSSNAIDGGVRVLVFGLNQNAIGSGVIADVQLNISPEAPFGAIPITVTGIVASDTAANSISTKDTAGSIQVVAPELVFPRFSTAGNELGLDTISGIGIANLDTDPASVTFTAVESDGSITAGPDFDNPVKADLKGKEQLPIVDTQIFGNGLLNLESNGYIKLERTNGDISGFFLIFDGDLKFQDGANLSDRPLTDFAFTEIQTDGYNKVSIINNNPEDAELTIDLMGADGGIRSSISKVIAANGSLTADLFRDLFFEKQPFADDYIRVKSSIGVQPFQVMRQRLGDIAILAGQDLTVGETTLYSPLYAVGGRYRTSLSIINLDSEPGTVTLRLINQDGIQVGRVRVADISANGKLYLDDPRFFANFDTNVLNTGYLEVVGNGIRLIGSTVFGDMYRQSFSAALALISRLQESVLYSHVASNDIYFTGLCILNPGLEPTLVRLELYGANGRLREVKNEVLGPKQRQSRLLWEYFSSLKGRNQTSGYVRLFSDSPIASYAAFGTHDLSIISAIPPQVIH